MSADTLPQPLAEREQWDQYARLKAIYLDEHPDAQADEFEAYCRLLAAELWI